MGVSSPVHELVWGPPHVKWRLARAGRLAAAAFPGIRFTDDAARAHIASFAIERPQKFFDREVRDATLQLVTDEARALASSPLAATTWEAFHAALSELRRINSSWTDDARPRYVTDPESREWLRARAFPAYVQIAEWVYCSLLGCLLEIKAAIPGGPRKTPPTLLTPRWEMARKRLASCFTTRYDPVIRNAITHGGVRFDGDHVVFTDDHGKTRRLALADASMIGEALLDLCNGMAAALAQLSASGQLPKWFSTEWIATEQWIASAHTPFLRPASLHIDRDPTGPGYQVEISGVHWHWGLDFLWMDLGRTLLLLRQHFPSATRFAINLSGPRGTPCFLLMPANEIPTLEGSRAELGTMIKGMSTAALIWSEQATILHELLSRRPATRLIGAWNTAVDYSLDSNFDFDLREVRDISVGWRSRFDATVVSVPTANNLEPDGTPSAEYLMRIFLEVAARWLIRPRNRRPLGAGRLRLPTLGVITVLREDRRLHELRAGGLTTNLLFRYELTIGRPVSGAFFGSTLRRIGPFMISINTAAEPYLGAIARTAPP